MSYAHIAALVATTASVATWNMLAPVSDRSAAMSGARIEGQVQPAPAKVAAIPVRSAPSPRETTRPPVPLLLTHRAPIVPASSASWDDVVSQDGAVAPPGNFADEKAAKAAIERDGYKRVRVLTRGPGGVWRARAFRGETEVAVSVDSAGNVSTD